MPTQASSFMLHCSDPEPLLSAKSSCSKPAVETILLSPGQLFAGQYVDDGDAGFLPSDPSTVLAHALTETHGQTDVSVRGLS